MKKFFNNIFNSKRATIILFIIYALLMGIATIVEKYYDTVAAKKLIYYSPLFFLIHLLMILNFIGITIKYHLFKKRNWHYILLHCSFIIILLGATLTHFFSKEGVLHLREGERTNQIVLTDKYSEEIELLPFYIELVDFKLIRYPGSQSPSSYESFLKLYVHNDIILHKVYMNNVLDFKGYRFYQASYDTDEMGSVLSVSYDKMGRRVTYTGYFLLFLGLFSVFFNKNSRFRQLSKRLKMNIVILGLMLFFSSFTNLFATNNTSFSKQKENHSKKLCETPVQSANGRIVPLHTLGSEILRKVYGEEKYNDLSIRDFLISVIAYPEKWADESIIKVNNKNLPSQYQWSKKYISYRDAFDDKGMYRLSTTIADIYRKDPTKRSLGERELLKLDEKINILHMLLRFQVFKLFPLNTDTERHQWYSPTDNLASFKEEEARLITDLFQNYHQALRKATLDDSQWAKADTILEQIQSFQKLHNTGLDISEKKMAKEVMYNKMNLRKVAQKGYLILGIILLLISFYSITTSNGIIKTLRKLIIGGIVLCCGIHTYDIGLRWYLAGNAPWSNSYETMVALAWASILGGLLFGIKDKTVMGLATIFGGIALFVSGLSWMDPQISPLVPVLKSPWLTFHVAVLILSYGFLGISCMIGTSNLILYIFRQSDKKTAITQRIKRLTIINEMSLIIGLIFLIIGIFLGAIWANESWGRYWSWDPKETWALITAIIYATVLHLHWFNKQKNNWLLNLLSQLSFLSVLMTFLGVNYFLSGMHSYGNSNSIYNTSGILILLFIVFFVLPGSVSFILRKTKT